MTRSSLILYQITVLSSTVTKRKVKRVILLVTHSMAKRMKTLTTPMAIAAITTSPKVVSSIFPMPLDSSRLKTKQ